ncbi:asparagine synthase (glutamine-hydrolyzing) [Arenibaculum sp.]|jgi:asparagine synthase (glutamine-hydrolysing)|uniref:asparagine synthase (glutamine-hydrolyzing) n=1 Tax=Arenibaculum sp. TaxID=2865862 RepID=UPI002E0E2566|nr:asparagine synthase (glutamine-hydrolyzing) [Arenibaculum sp.]
MCGVTGFWDPTGRIFKGNAVGVARAMAGRLGHRGPDDAAEWADADAGVVLAHRRLAVVGLGPGGRQPMASACGRYVLSFNGEIYNHLDLRRELEGAGHRFRTDCDTEVFVEALALWGVEAALRRTTGMFALIFWDRSRRTLHLARDRLGEKPLYLASCGRTLLFASEAKAFDAYPGFTGTLDRAAVTQFLRFGYVPSPLSIHSNATKLLPGTHLEIDTGGLAPGWTSRDLVARARPYWSARDVAAETTPFGGSDDEAVDALEAVLSNAIARQLVADVPVGTFLSGGVDSSVVVALAQARSTRPLRTFTMGFHDAAFDEAGHARAVARAIGTEHTEFYVTAEDARAVIPALPTIWDEPFADSSQIPTFLVSRLARSHVTVALSGDGGDELFGGYRRHFLAQCFWPHLGALPLPARRGAARILRLLASATLAASNAVPGAGRLRRRVDDAQKIAEAICTAGGADLHRSLVSLWADPAAVVIGGREPDGGPDSWDRDAIPGGDVGNMMLRDLSTYLPDDILTKVDRASMAVSLETRAPMLDHSVVEFAWSLPAEMKIRDGSGKWIMKRLLERHLPAPLANRPKQGFGIPLGDWLRGPLRVWAEDLLDRSRLSREGVFVPDPIVAAWNDHVSGRRNLQHAIWPVLMFQAWLDKQTRINATPDRLTDDALLSSDAHANDLVKGGSRLHG